MPAGSANQKFTDEQLIELLKAGYTNKECAERLKVSSAAISIRKKALGDKLQLQIAGDVQKNLLSVPVAAENLRLLMDETKKKLLEAKSGDKIRDYTAVAELMLKIITFTISTHKDIFKIQERQELKAMLLDLLRNKSKAEQKDILMAIQGAKKIESFLEDD